MVDVSFDDKDYERLAEHINYEELGCNVDAMSLNNAIDLPDLADGVAGSLTDRQLDYIAERIRVRNEKLSAV